MAAALRDAGHWAEVVDRQWYIVYSTDEQRRIYGGPTELAPVALGTHFFGADAVRTRLGWRSGPNTPELIRELFLAFGGLALADTEGGRTSLRALVDPALADVVPMLARRDASPALTLAWHWTHLGMPVDALTTAVRIHDGSGQVVGTALISKPAAGMDVLAAMAVAALRNS
jgi:alkylation response protein AidB-like acyl-CoA dehydrogenase